MEEPERLTPHVQADRKVELYSGRIDVGDPGWIVRKVRDGKYAVAFRFEGSAWKSSSFVVIEVDDRDILRVRQHQDGPDAVLRNDVGQAKRNTQVFVVGVERNGKYRIAEARDDDRVHELANVAKNEVAALGGTQLPA